MMVYDDSDSCKKNIGRMSEANRGKPRMHAASPCRHNDTGLGQDARLDRHGIHDEL